MIIYLVRASHANEFELQNYAQLQGKYDIRVVTTPHPLTKISLPSVTLWSPTELPQFPLRRQLANRVIGGEQWLVGLETLLSEEKKSNGSNHRTVLHTAETYTPYTHQAVQMRKRHEVAKLVCTCWETIPHANEKFARVRQWKREAYRYVDVFHTPTARAKAALVAEGVNPKKIVVIPYGVDLARFTNAVRKRKNKKPVVLMAARAVAEKGVDIFRALAEEMKGVADLLLVSGVPYDEMPGIYADADIFFLPSQTTPTWEEQYGMALVEAMASGLPIVSTRSGAIPEVVGRAGILVPEQDVEGMRQAITKLVSDKKLREEYGARSLARARTHYDRLRAARRLGAVYNNLV